MAVKGFHYRYCSFVHLTLNVLHCEDKHKVGQKKKEEPVKMWLDALSPLKGSLQETPLGGSQPQGRMRQNGPHEQPCSTALKQRKLDYFSVDCIKIGLYAHQSLSSNTGIIQTR